MTFTEDGKRYSVHQLKEAVVSQLGMLTQNIKSTDLPAKIIRYEFACEHIDPLIWLHNQNVQEKIYWANRDNRFEMGGIGIAHIVTGDAPYKKEDIFKQMGCEMSATGDGLRYYGGFAFDSASGNCDWRGLRQYRFVVPRFEICRKDTNTYLAVNIAPEDMLDINTRAEIGIQELLSHISFERDTLFRKVPVVQQRQDRPDNGQWKNMIKQALGDVRARRFDKIVLARQSCFSFDKPINPVALISHLRNSTPGCYHFCLQTGEFQGFIGASPERLYMRRHRAIMTEALAGTMPGGVNKKDNFQLADKLLHSDKNVREHQFVVDAIKDQMTNICSSFTYDLQPKVLSLPYWQHLLTGFSGTLRNGIPDYELIDLLHPSPAIAGSPRKEVIGEINDIEPFSRGWYAGLVGCVGNDAVEFCVAIRSALVSMHNLYLYAGAGIIDSSCAEEEWNEIEHKIINFLKVFKADPDYRYENE